VTATAAGLGPAVLLRAAPRREPPFDDELPDRLTSRRDRPLPLRIRAGRAPALPPPPAAPLPAALPDPAGWGRRLLVGIIETAGGRRPLPQLTALLSQSVAAGLTADFERAAGAGHAHWTHAAQVRSVHASRPSDGVAELSATVQAGRRVRAIALRLEVRHGRWRCTRLQLG
jgi:hypothetical protein